LGKLFGTGNVNKVFAYSPQILSYDIVTLVSLFIIIIIVVVVVVVIVVVVDFYKMETILLT
jgi:hypothetical protein